MTQYNSFAEYLNSLPDNTVFRLWQYKRMFTPYEQAQQFADQTIYKDDEAEYVIIEDAISLPDGDLLLITHSEDYEPYKNYYKLSEIALALSETDN